jgi:hypothetical protein
LNGAGKTTGKTRLAKQDWQNKTGNRRVRPAPTKHQLAIMKGIPGVHMFLNEHGTFPITD